MLFLFKFLFQVHALTKNSAPFIVRAPAPKPKPVEQSHKAAIPEESAPKSYKTSEKSNESSGFCLLFFKFVSIQCLKNV